MEALSLLLAVCGTAAVAVLILAVGRERIWAQAQWKAHQRNSSIGLSTQEFHARWQALLEKLPSEYVNECYFTTHFFAQVGQIRGHFTFVSTDDFFKRYKSELEQLADNDVQQLLQSLTAEASRRALAGIKDFHVRLLVHRKSSVYCSFTGITYSF